MTHTETGSLVVTTASTRTAAKLWESQWKALRGTSVGVVNAVVSAQFIRNNTRSEVVWRTFRRQSVFTGETMSKTENKAAADMTEAMEKTMQRLQGRFQAVSEQLESKIDEMGTRIDDLEKNVAELMTQAGMEEKAGSK